MNKVQRQVSQVLGNGAGERLDYSLHQLTRKVPGSVQELDALRMEAHDQGPGSDAWLDYHHLLQAGMDRDELPEAGGGVPRHITDTALELQAAAETRQQHFRPGLVDPLLLSHGWNGRSFSDWGPEASRQIVSEQMATALPHERAVWLAVSRAIDDSPASNMSISYEAPDAGLEWRAPMADDNINDPSGLSQRFAGRSDDSAPGLSDLFIRNAGADPSLAGVDMATVGAGGGTWWADLAIAQENAAAGRSTDYHQGDAVLEPISPL